jgi:hypothetical protein
MEPVVTEPMEGLISDGQEFESVMPPEPEDDGVMDTPIEDLAPDEPFDDLALEETLVPSESMGAPEVPDFGAEFADLPSLEEKAGGEFGEDLVQGADFGTPTDPVAGVDAGSGTAGPDGIPATSAEEPARAGQVPPTSAEEPARSGQAAATSAEEPARSSSKFEDPAKRPPRRKPPKKKRSMPVLVGILAVLCVVLAAVGTATGVVNVPGFTFLQGMFGEVPYPALTLENSAQPNEPVIRYSLELLTYEDTELIFAVGMRDDLRSELPGLLFTLVPRESDGVTSYAILAGPALNLIDAENLRGPISEELAYEEPDSWPIRETPRAFYLGERPTLDEAQEFLAGLEAEGVWGYILHVTYPDGQEAYEVLAGAFEGVLDARPLQLTLWDLGFRDAPLIERRGRVPE